MPSENRSVHWWCHYAIKERSTAHVISVHIMTSHNTSWHLATDHGISQQIMTSRNTSCRLTTHHGCLWCLLTHGTGWFITQTLDTDARRWLLTYTGWFMMFLSHGHWTQMQGDDFYLIPGGLWCFPHGTGWFITRTLDTDARRWLLTKNIISLLYNDDDDKLTSSGCSTDRPIRQTSYFGPSG